MNDKLIEAAQVMGEKPVMDELAKRLNCTREAEAALQIYVGAINYKLSKGKVELTSLRRKLTRCEGQLKFLLDGLEIIGNDCTGDESEGVRVLLKDMARKLSKREFDSQGEGE